jgi:formylglycine-generating enzyme required for sulfatase activity
MIGSNRTLNPLKRLKLNFRLDFLLAPVIMLLFLSVGCKEKATIAELPESYENLFGQEFIKIQKGEFDRGARLSTDTVVERYGGEVDWYENEHPMHRVALSEDFMCAKYEVTKSDFDLFIKSTDYRTDCELKKSRMSYWNGSERSFDDTKSWINPGHHQESNFPVVGITFNDASNYIVWLNDNDTSLPNGYKYSLPSEAQWEYTARAGSTTSFFWGNDDVDGVSFGNFADSSGLEAHQWKRFQPWNDGFPESAPVGHFSPNDFGIYDIIGNVYEWTLDCGGDQSNYETGEYEDPISESDCSKRYLRGGSWHSNNRGLRCAKRKAYDADIAFDNVGLRLFITSTEI